MRCRIFNIRLSDQFRVADEERFSAFLERVDFKRVFASTAQVGGETVWSVLLLFEENAVPETEGKSADEAPQLTEPLTGEEAILYEELRKWRNDKASQEGVAAYMIAHNRWLLEMVKLRAKTQEDLARIKGFGERRAHRYGAEILRIVAKGTSEGA